MYRVTPVVKYLLIINIALFAVQMLTGLGFVDVFGLRYFEAEEFRVWQVFTHIFIHADFTHLLGNMFGLFMFGPTLEERWGDKKFLIFYLVCAFGASALYSGVNAWEIYELKNTAAAVMAHTTPESFAAFLRDEAFVLYNQNLTFLEAFKEAPNSEHYISEARHFVRDTVYGKTNIPMVGASGAIFAILMAFGMLYPNTKLMLLFPPIPIKAKYFVTAYGIFELYSIIQNSPTDNVAHFAHLGGMLFAFFFVKAWKE